MLFAILLGSHSVFTVPIRGVLWQMVFETPDSLFPSGEVRLAYRPEGFPIYGASLQLFQDDPSQTPHPTHPNFQSVTLLSIFQW